MVLLTAVPIVYQTAMPLQNVATGCQSNCILEPKPPGSKTSGSMLESRVIGYYEAWSARKSCHKVKPTDLPLDALTQVNFAFAYIDPKTYRIVTMDAQTPSSLFKDTANLKSIKPSLEVFVSVGGWTFSDDGTPTQPVFSDIASDPSKRQTFADNVVDFMKLYGFDGIDLDWEYPGAPDRGGKPEDTKNYVALMKTLRETFDASGNTFGLTFTAPSSYWYLRWFDLPGLIRHVDYINLMSYDLHGVWDRDNPIGSIVQSHTNLTEIKLAAELFWRVKIPASKIVMGFGFYGRSFTLSDPSCDKPGCQFSGASTPGPCSDAGGILAYYEIMDALEADKSIKPTHDSKAAINYFKFDKDQWISYDDEKTFRQKIDWANSMGFGGALIWASDLDDDQYSAHAALIGREVRSSAQLQLVDKALSAPQSVIQNLAGSNGQDCFKHTGKCVDLDDDDAMAAACGSGYTVVGWDDAGCGTKKCVTSACSYAPCRESCPSGTKSVFSKTDECIFGSQQYCCPEPVELKDCHWTGGSGGEECSNAVCDSTELELARAQFGGSAIGGCSWGRKKAACCTIEKATPKPASCSADLCEEIPGYCSSMTGTAENLKRDVQIHDSGLSLDLYSLEKRETTTYKAILYTGSVVVVTAANYPRIGRLFKIANRNQVLKQAFRLIPGYCLGPSVQELAINVGTTGVLRGLQAEHPIDRQIMAAFIESAAAGTLRGKAQNIVPAIGAQFFEIYWNYNNPLLSTLPRIGGPDGISPSTINDRIMECFGSNFWPEPLLPTEASINAAKGRLMNFQAATGIDTIMELAKAAVLADTPAAADKLLQAVRVGIAVFDYINTPDATSKWNLVRQQIFHQFGLIENVYGVANLQRWWLLFSSDYFVGVQEHAQ
ncbi:glycoside hydrolase family 18 protein, partial [Hortaea werneckii]